jgi:hypothetical protein
LSIRYLGCSNCHVTNKMCILMTGVRSEVNINRSDDLLCVSSSSNKCKIYYHYIWGSAGTVFPHPPPTPVPRTPEGCTHTRSHARSRIAVRATTHAPRPPAFRQKMVVGAVGISQFSDAMVSLQREGPGAQLVPVRRRRRTWTLH